MPSASRPTKGSSLLQNGLQGQKGKQAQLLSPIWATGSGHGTALTEGERGSREGVGIGPLDPTTDGRPWQELLPASSPLSQSRLAPLHATRRRTVLAWPTGETPAFTSWPGFSHLARALGMEAGGHRRSGEEQQHAGGGRFVLVLAWGKGQRSKSKTAVLPVAAERLSAGRGRWVLPRFR